VKDELKERFRRLVEETRSARDHVRGLVAAKRWTEAEPDRGRMMRFMSRKADMSAPRGKEALIGDTVDLQAASFLPEGAQARRAVAYVEVSGPKSSTAGTGFLISPNLFITNQHVIEDADAARGAQIVFDREADELGRPRSTSAFLLDPDRFALFSPVDALDYAVIAIGPLNSGSGSIEDFGFCALSNRPDKHAIGMSVNIIQHPLGWPKMIALRNNMLQLRTDRTLLYETDTDHGSSGAPVFNDEWELIALHHYGEPFLERSDETGHPISATVNEGVRISAIYDDLEARLATLDPVRQSLLREALAYDKQAQARPPGRRLDPPRPAKAPAESIPLDPTGARMPIPSNKPDSQQQPIPQDQQELHITIPIEITVRIGAGGAATGASVRQEPPAARTLARAAEALKVDQDYSNRAGYDPAFILGAEVPLPTPSADLAKQVAALRAGEPNAEDGELKYEHFSIKMNKGKRVAIFSATNIDGETYQSVDRRSGKVADAAEAERWFNDPRISASFFLGQSFYSDWSDFFDRGHLTRRSDPTWGPSDEAERANADTFHFTNCSPQHFRFNQTTPFWQGAERYVLENGALVEDSRKRICVFQGPIFDDRIDMLADAVQIPSSFFKVIVWKGARGLKAVGLVVDQRNLLSESRRSLGSPRDVPSIDISQWRMAIAAIEKRTGLDFGPAIRAADTIGQGPQPRVGEEAVFLVKSLADLLPA
jgi:endonuclease G